MNLEIKDLIGEAVNNAIARRNSNDLTILSEEEAAKVEGGRMANPSMAGGITATAIAGGKTARPPIKKSCPPVVVGLVINPIKSC